LLSTAEKGNSWKASPMLAFLRVQARVRPAWTCSNAAHTCCKVEKKDKNTNLFFDSQKWVCNFPEDERPLYAGDTRKYQQAARWFTVRYALKEAVVGEASPVGDTGGAA